MADYIISEQTLTGIADAIRDMRHEKGVMTPKQMEAKIRASRTGIPIEISNHINPETGKWERPEEYPDLDSIEIPSDADVVYMTYDLRKTPGYGWIGIYCNMNGGAFYVDRGHLNNGEFVVDERLTGSAGSRIRHNLDDTYGDVQLWRVTATTPIQSLALCANSETTSECYHNQLQPLVERVGRLQYWNPTSGNAGPNYSYHKHGSMWLEREKIACACGRTCTNLSDIWSNCYSLQSLDVSEWNVENWNITSFSNTWAYCYLLRELDLSSWDVSGWSVTTLSGTWNNCHSLEKLNLSNWDTSNWAVTTLYCTWYQCYSLKELDISSWDTINWAVTTLYMTWSYCPSIRYLDLNDWDTSGWVVNTMYNTWYYCCSLEKLNIDSWDTSNWAVATLANTWAYCFSLSQLNIEDWDTSKWAVTTLANTWYQCMELKSLDLSSWDTSNWVNTSLTGTWVNCFSLKELNVSTWDTSKWAVTTMASAWNGCYSLQELNINSWDTSNWAVTNLSNTWASCYSLKELNLNSWDTSNWAVTNIYYLFTSNTGLKRLNISNWNTSKWAVTNAQSIFNNNQKLEYIRLPNGFGITSSTQINSATIPNIYNLIDYNGTGAFNFDHSYANAYKLTPTSVRNILNKLPTVSSTKTLTLGQTNKNKVSAEDIAVATQKGWTVA